MATDKVILRDEKPAGEDLSTKQFFLVKITTTSTLVLAASGDRPYVLDSTPKSGEIGTYDILGIVKVKLGGTVEPGDLVASKNDGTGQKAVSGQLCVGQALEKGESGAIISVLALPGAKA